MKNEERKKLSISLLAVTGVVVLSLLMLTGRGQTSVDAVGYVVVDDFESYESLWELLAVWNDYWVNGSGAELILEKDPNFVRDGNNSVMFFYNNEDWSYGYYSEAYVNPADLEVGPDWTVSGANTLVIYFYGHAGNSATINERMWMELEDTSNNVGLVLYDGDANDVTEEWWHKWDIDLGLFDACGVELTEIGRLAIGFGRYPPLEPGGIGKVHFDDIRLWKRMRLHHRRR